MSSSPEIVSLRRAKTLEDVGHNQVSLSVFLRLRGGPSSTICRKSGPAEVVRSVATHGGRGEIARDAIRLAFQRTSSTADTHNTDADNMISCQRAVDAFWLYTEEIVGKNGWRSSIPTTSPPARWPTADGDPEIPSPAPRTNSSQVRRMARVRASPNPVRGRARGRPAPHCRASRHGVRERCGNP